MLCTVDPSHCVWDKKLAKHVKACVLVGKRKRERAESAGARTAGQFSVPNVNNTEKGDVAGGGKREKKGATEGGEENKGTVAGNAEDAGESGRKGRRRAVDVGEEDGRRVAERLATHTGPVLQMVGLFNARQAMFSTPTVKPQDARVHPSFSRLFPDCHLEDCADHGTSQVHFTTVHKCPALSTPLAPNSTR